MKVSTVSNDISEYLSGSEKIVGIDMMPALDKLPKYKDINYQCYRYNTWLTSRGKSYVLVVTYDKDTYTSEKAKLDKTYTFLDHPLRGNYCEDGEHYKTGEYTIPEYKFKCSGYDFRVVKDEYSYYPYWFGMIGVNDSSRSIAYVYFYDQEIKHISSMNDFVMKDCSFGDFIKAHPKLSK
jgi:hypothetical protein